MRRLKALTVAAIAVGVGVGIPAFVGAQSTNAIVLADKEGIFIDSKSFTILPGRTKEELAGLLSKLDARTLRPGAIIFRAGDQLYLAEPPGTADRYGGSRNDYGTDRYGGSRNDYGSDRYGGSRNDYGSDRYGGSRNDYGSDRYGGSRNDYGSDRYGGSRNDYGSDRYGGSRNDYGSDRYGSDR